MLFPVFDFRVDSNVKTLTYCDRKLTCFFLPLKLLSGFGKGCSHHTQDLDSELVNRILANKLKKPISSQQVQKLLHWTTVKVNYCFIKRIFHQDIKKFSKSSLLKVDKQFTFIRRYEKIQFSSLSLSASICFPVSVFLFLNSLVQFQQHLSGEKD